MDQLLLHNNTESSGNFEFTHHSEEEEMLTMISILTAKLIDFNPQLGLVRAIIISSHPSMEIGFCPI